MFDKLFEFILNIWERIVPFIIIREYEQGAFLRFGKLKRIINRGIYFKIPYFDEVQVHDVLTTAMKLDPQSITTVDDKEIVVKGIIKYRVHDLSKFYTEVFNSTDAISDVSMGIIRNVISKKTWEECKRDTLNREITNKVRSEAFKWGLEVELVTLSDLSRMKSIRLLSLNNHKPEGNE